MFSRYHFCLAFLLACTSPCFAQPQFDEWTISHFRQAREAEQAGKLDVAAAEYEEIVRRNPGVAEIYANLGLIYYRQTKYHAAIGTLQRAIDINPNLVGAQLFLGISLYMTQDFEGALPALQKALELKPDDRQVRLYLGLVFLALDQPEKAAHRLQEALAVFPDDIDVLYRLGEAYLEGASQGSRLLFERHRDSACYDWARGLAAEQEGDVAQAITSYLRALERDPTIPQIYRRLVALFDRAELPDLATAARKRTRQFFSSPPTPLDQHSPATVALSDREQEVVRGTWNSLGETPSDVAVEVIADADANESLREALRSGRFPDLPTALSLYHDGKFQSAAGKLRAMLQTNDSAHWIIPYLLARSYLWTGDHEAAQEILETHLQAMFHLPSVALLRVEIQTPLASSFLDQVMATAPDSWQAKVLRAKAFASAHKIDEAIDSYRAVLVLRPTLPGIHLAIGNLQTNRQEWHLAIQQYLAELELAPDNGLALAMLGRAYLEVRDPDKAITTLRKSLDRYPNSAKALADLGKALLAKDQTEEAISVFKRALHADPEDYSIHYRLFQLYQKAGQSELARHHLAVFRDKKGKE